MALDVVSQLFRGCVAILWLRAKSIQHDGVEIARKGSAQIGR
jgi:hypothetical protein